jgi:predicted enzyme related to lactoylglutathione lyase
MKNAINWFEIPVADLDRATLFYERVLGITLKREKFEGVDMAIFSSDEQGVGGALISDARRKPHADGALVYLDASGKLDACVARVAESGGKVVLPKTGIGDPGFIALVVDSEGNTVGLHAPREERARKSA